MEVRLNHYLQLNPIKTPETCVPQPKSNKHDVVAVAFCFYCACPSTINIRCAELLASRLVRLAFPAREVLLRKHRLRAHAQSAVDCPSVVDG